MKNCTLGGLIFSLFVTVAPVALGQADLRLVFSNTNGGGCPPPCGQVYAGGHSSYAAALENAGPNPASNMTLTVTLPPGITIDQPTAYLMSCSVNQTITATTITCTAPAVPVAVAAGSLSFVAHLPQNYPYLNGLTASAVVSATTPDPQPANNTVTETLPVLPPQVPASGTMTLVALFAVLAAVGAGRSLRS